MSFSVLYKEANSHGIIVAISLPSPAVEIPTSAWRQLRKEEVEYAKTLPLNRQVTWIGGRIAAHIAANSLNIDSGSILNDSHGAPVPREKRLALSIAHKSDIAVAIVAQKKHGSLGIDVETLLPERPQIASKILRKEEVGRVFSLPKTQQWLCLLIHFCIKKPTHVEVVSANTSNPNGTELRRNIPH